MEYIDWVAWFVEYTDEFNEWWQDLAQDEQENLTAGVELLMERGPHLGYPHSSGVNGSHHGHMRELRVQSGGKPLRVFYAFNPLRSAILLIGGGKTGDSQFYEHYVPIADRLYDEHLEELRKEGMI